MTDRTLTLGTIADGFVTAELNGATLPVLMRPDDVVITTRGRYSPVVVELNLAADRITIKPDGRAVLVWGDQTTVVEIDPDAEIRTAQGDQALRLSVVCDSVVAARVGTVTL